MTSTHEADLPQLTIVGTRSIVPLAELQTFFAAAFTTARNDLDRAGIAMIGAPVGVYFESKAGAVDVLAGFPVASESNSDIGLSLATIPAGHAVTAVHEGRYDSVGDTYAELSQWTHARGLGEPHVMTEQYLVGPADDPDPSTWRTLITYYLDPSARAPGVGQAEAAQ